jgi:hypothetical protein
MNLKCCILGHVFAFSISRFLLSYQMNLDAPDVLHDVYICLVEPCVKFP